MFPQLVRQNSDAPVELCDLRLQQGDAGNLCFEVLDVVGQGLDAGEQLGLLLGVQKRVRRRLIHHRLHQPRSGPLDEVCSLSLGLLSRRGLPVATDHGLDARAERRATDERYEDGDDVFPHGGPPRSLEGYCEHYHQDDQRYRQPERHHHGLPSTHKDDRRMRRQF